MNKIKVLNVDDSPFIHKAVARALNSEEYELCAVAKNGREGYELYFSQTPDVVVMDITMPIMDGLEASAVILEKDPHAKIIMLSAMGDDELISNAKAIGIKEFLQKPFKADELTSAIQKIIKE